MERDYEIFHASLKALLRKGDEFLILIDANDDKYDLPGGRIDNVEANVPLKQIMQREVGEELGLDVHYKFGRPLFQYRTLHTDNNTRVLSTVYEAEYISGDIQLSPEHKSYEWVNPKTGQLDQNRFKTEEQRKAIQNYFQSYGN